MENEIQVSDIYLVAMLKVKGYNYEKAECIKNNNFKRIEFVFNSTPQLLKEVRDYFQTDCEPYKKYIQELKELKNLIHNI